MTASTNSALRLASFEDFRALFEGSPSEYLDLATLAARATKVGRVLIQGQAGVGKSHLAGELDAMLRDAGRESVLVSVALASHLVAPAEESDEALTAELLSSYGGRLGHPTTFIIDDLDSLPPSIADRVLRVVEEITSVHPEWSAIVTDRITRRSIREQRWLLAGWVDSTDSTAPTWADLPFYQKISGSRFAEPDDAIESVFEAAGISQSWIESLARVVFESREATGGDLLDRQDLGRDVLQTLEMSDMVSHVDTGKLVFRHALFADYLVGRVLSRTPSLWTKAGFQAATFDGSRVESLNLALGQMEPERVDDFVRRVDDWNYRAASALVAFDLGNAKAISPQLRSAILTLLGIRRFSRLESIASAVEDALSLHGGEYARRMLETHSVAEVANRAKAEMALAGEWPEFVEAVDVPRDDARALETYVSGLRSDDEILAWARSNVLACGPVVNNLGPLLDPLVNDPDESVAWRAVHALGSARDSAAAGRLAAVVSGSYPRWVKYGAIQSFLIVLDALEPGEMAEHADFFIAAIGELVGEAHFRRAVRRGLSLRDPSLTWCAIALRVVGEAIAQSETLAEHDEWLRLSASIRIRGHS